MPIRVLIADDHVLVRSGLHELLRASPDLEVVGEAGDGAETLRLAAALRPDLVLLDVSMPGGGIAIAQRLKESHAELVVLVLTMHEDESLMHQALHAGAAGYVVKRAEPSELLEAIRAVCRGEIYVHPAMTRRAAATAGDDATPARPSAPAPPTALTPRELDVLRLLARGNTNRQIAGLLGLSPRTIESHRANLMGKLGLVSRVELVEYAEEHDLL